MPRSRSRDRERRKKSRSRSRDRRRSRDRDNKRRDKSVEKYSSRDKYESSHRRRSRDRSSERSHRKRSSERDRKRRDSRERKRSSSRSRRQRSNSSDRKSSHKKHQSGSSVKPIVIIANMNKKGIKDRIKDRSTNSDLSSTNTNPLDHRASFEISNEFSEEGFEQFSRDHGIDFTKIDTEEDRIAVHEKMEELLKAHFAAQGKVYPPPKQEKPVVNNLTGFANDGSFLEQFKKMQEEMKQQHETEQKRQTLVNNLKNLPINKRRGGKILKTGLVAKTIVTPEGTITTNSYDSYYKEVQKYKNSSSCDSDSKTRPLVK